MTDLTKLHLSNVFDTLNLVPKITNLVIDRRDQSVINTTFEIDCPLSSANAAWITNEKITKLLQLTITFSLDADTTDKLLTNNDALFNLRKSGLAKDTYIQINKKIDNSFINFAQKVNTMAETSILSTFTEKIVLDTPIIKHLTVFVAIHIDNDELSSRFSVARSKLTKIIGTANYLTYINDFKYENANITDNTIFKTITQFNFTSLMLNKTVDESLKIKKLYGLKNVQNHYSELYHSFNKMNQLFGIFKVNLESIFKLESRYAGLYSNPTFRNEFFNTPSNYLPESIKIIRIDEHQNEDVIINQAYADNINTDTCKITKLNINDVKSNLWISFLDKQTSKLKNKYKYKVELTFKDATIPYIEKLKGSISDEYVKIQQIINIAKSGDYYSLTTNTFSNSLIVDLMRQNLSIKDIILNTGILASKFLYFSDDVIQTIKYGANSPYINFEKLDTISNTLAFLQSEITRLQNYAQATDSNRIKAVHEYSTFISLDTNNITSVSIVDTKMDKACPYIQINDYVERVKREIDKYYTVHDINSDIRFSYLTPNRIFGKYSRIQQDILNTLTIDFAAYNDLVLNLYVDAIYEGDFSTFSTNEKLLMILSHFDIIKNSLSDKTINKVNHDVNKTTKNAEVNKPEVKDERLDALLFETFIRCAVVKDTKMVNFDTMDPVSAKLKRININANHTPFQIYSIYQLLNNEDFIRLSKNLFTDNLKNYFYYFAYYMNFKLIYAVEYLDIATDTWKLLDITTLNTLENNDLICRYINYKNENLDLHASDIVFHSIDDVFVLSGDNTKVRTENLIFENTRKTPATSTSVKIPATTVDITKPKITPVATIKNTWTAPVSQPRAPSTVARATVSSSVPLPPALAQAKSNAEMKAAFTAQVAAKATQKAQETAQTHAQFEADAKAASIASELAAREARKKATQEAQAASTQAAAKAAELEAQAQIAKEKAALAEIEQKRAADEAKKQARLAIEAEIARKEAERLASLSATSPTDKLTSKLATVRETSAGVSTNKTTALPKATATPKVTAPAPKVTAPKPSSTKK